MTAGFSTRLPDMPGARARGCGHSRVVENALGASGSVSGTDFGGQNRSTNPPRRSRCLCSGRSLAYDSTFLFLFRLEQQFPSSCPRLVVLRVDVFKQLVATAPALSSFRPDTYPSSQISSAGPNADKTDLLVHVRLDAQHRGQKYAPLAVQFASREGRIAADHLNAWRVTFAGGMWRDPARSPASAMRGTARSRKAGC